MRPIGDLDADELALSPTEATARTLAVPPAIPDLRRRLLLTRLVLPGARRRGEEPLLPGQAAAARGEPRPASRQGRDARAQASRGFADLVPDELAEHWQARLRFLAILPSIGRGSSPPKRLLDPAERRNRLLAAQTAAWRRAPPRASGDRRRA